MYQTAKGGAAWQRCFYWIVPRGDYSIRGCIDLHLGILYLAGSLRQAGHDVQVLDCHEVTSWDAEREKLIIYHDKLEPCDVLGLSATTANVNYGSELAEAWPATIKVLGGSHVSHIMEGPHEEFKQGKYFRGFDYVMVGECENAFVQFCDAFGEIRLKERSLGPTMLKTFPGLVWFTDEGRADAGWTAPTLPDVTKLAPPAFDLWKSGFAKGALSSSSFVGRQVNANEKLSASIFSARGCPYGCKFCADARTPLREETLEQIKQEVRQLAELGVQAVRVQDDTFTIREPRCRDISDVFADHGMLWRACTRVNLKNPALFKYMAEHGCTELGFGVEHGSAKMLKLMNKGTTPEANELGIKMCQEAGMIARAFLMIGFPGETRETIQEMKAWVERVRPDSCVLSLFQPYPGSDVWDHPEQYGVTIPPDAFARMWQLGADKDPQTLVLELPTISKQELFEARLELAQWLDSTIGHLDRTRLDGNVGTFVSEACIA